MGVFPVEIQVGDPQASSFESVEALVDTGATNTVLPASLLSRLAVNPYTKSIFELADGSRLDLDIGRTWVKLDGKQEFTQIVFGEDQGGAILGLITLEEMGLAVDPVGRRLVPVNKLLKQGRVSKPARRARHQDTPVAQGVTLRGWPPASRP